MTGRAIHPARPADGGAVPRPATVTAGFKNSVTGDINRAHVLALIQVRRQTTKAEIAAELDLNVETVALHLRSLRASDEIHQVRRFGAGNRAGFVYAPGAEPQFEGEADVEPIQLTVKRWAGCTPMYYLDALLFGRGEVRA